MIDIFNAPREYINASELGDSFLVDRLVRRLLTVWSLYLDLEMLTTWEDSEDISDATPGVRIMTVPTDTMIVRRLVIITPAIDSPGLEFF